MILNLKKKWTVGAPLDGGVGGFGRVFEAVGEDGEGAVAKFVDKAPGAERELLFGDETNVQAVPNVVPVWDTGEHKGKLVLVMPKAVRSLRQHLRDAGGALQMDDALEILTDVATALAGLADIAVHRDLKPENVLLLNGTWCLADFGIARYANASTDVATRKYAMTDQYAAPEQWRHERASAATDVYAFGVMAYELLAGRWPFEGPDFRHQHLHEMPPTLTAGTARLQVLVEQCLIKAPEARPTAEVIVQKLAKAQSEPQSSGVAALAALNRSSVESKAKAHAEQETAVSEKERRSALADAAQHSLSSIQEQLRSVIEEEAPEARLVPEEGRGKMLWVASLGAGKLGVASMTTFPESPWDGPFDVVAMSQVTVNQHPAPRNYAGRSHALWFCDAVKAGHYAWFEVGFMNFAMQAQGDLVPYPLDPRSAQVAFSRVMGTTQVAWGPEELDRADLDAFVDRWIGWFAAAGGSALQRPGMLPENGQPQSWRGR